jgi:hypothetical protein
MYYGTPPIVTNGLTLHLDAANQMSYTSGSTSWINLSGGASGSLIANPLYDPSNKGSLFFGATNTYVSTSISLAAQNTVSLWIRPDTGSTANGIFDAYTAAGTSGVLIRRATATTTTVFVADGTAQTGVTVNTPSGSWTNLTLVNDGTNARLYVNMDIPTVSTIARVHAVGQPIFLATRQRGGTNYWTGNIAHVQVYNRALSISEMLQNYNAVRLRYRF